MIVKSEKALWQWMAYLTVVITLAALFIIYLMNDVDDLWFKIIEYVLVGICYYIILCMVIACGRILILDEKGCTIRFWKYQKTYRWEEFKIKRMEDYRDIYRAPTTRFRIWHLCFFQSKTLINHWECNPTHMQCISIHFHFPIFLCTFMWILLGQEEKDALDTMM